MKLLILTKDCSCGKRAGETMTVCRVPQKRRNIQLCIGHRNVPPAPPALSIGAAGTGLCCVTVRCRAWGGVAAWAVAVGGLLCYLTGLMGYLSFRDATASDILDNFSGSLASFFKAVVVTHLILYIPSEVSEQIAKRTGLILTSLGSSCDSVISERYADAYFKRCCCCCCCC